jgi:hypothetical protein
MVMPESATPTPFFTPPAESSLESDEVRSHARAEFFRLRDEFLDRLACARVFDGDRFEALLLWLGTLEQCYARAGTPMSRSDLTQFHVILSYLENEAEHSRDQQKECAEALKRWSAIMRHHNVMPQEAN